MANTNERTVPPTPTTDALPPAGETTPTETTGSGARAVPKPSSRGSGTAAVSAPRTNGRADSPEAMRREIQATRDRLSGTLDAIEARIVHERESLERKKDELVDRATLKPVRDKLGREPWRSMAIGFLAGYIVAAIRD